VATAPPGVTAINPAFDVTPHRYITAIISEAGVARPPYRESLLLAVDSERAGRTPALQVVSQDEFDPAFHPHSNSPPSRGRGQVPSPSMGEG
jgi:hypothetical protein